ncbi:PPE family protein [Mycobacterium sp. M1]|uniref:PPE family protein n=1 Tax=Mycolicibacter acidiphilus TaxID=2835306 RepID=A0ABS5RPL3_9MYCO|nr:PPE family protein [Mycolicibacter acidiphilus]MBS9536227.1 PPE family protein [Mycolicibacter acidiphilus]
MIDFSMLPPEVTSERIYAGSGSAPLLAASSAWDHLAATLGSAAASYRAVVTELTDESWQGPASASMTAAAQPYLEWMTATASKAAQTAQQARAAAAAYEAAHATVVPPAMVAANQAELASLVAGNVLGQNNAAIAANQAEYSAMWAQDAAVMQTYAAGSAAAITPATGFAAAPQSTNPAGAAQTSGSAVDSGLGQILQTILKVLTNSSLNTGPLHDFLTSPLVTGFNTFSTKISGILGFIGGQGFMTAGVGVGGFDLPVQGAISAMYLWTALNPASLMSSVSGAGVAGAGLSEATLAGAAVSTGAIPGAIAGAAVPGSAAPAVTATLGRAATVGGLSAPASWITAAPNEIRLAGASLSMAAAPQAVAGMPSGVLGGMPMMAGMVNAPNGGTATAQSGAGGKQTTPVTATFGGGAGPQVVSPQREELNRLRQAVVEMTMQRDALKRSAASVIRRVKNR